MHAVRNTVIGDLPLIEIHNPPKAVAQRANALGTASARTIGETTPSSRAVARAAVWAQAAASARLLDEAFISLRSATASRD